MAEAVASDRRAWRRPAVLALLVLLGAIATVSAAATTWWTQRHLDALSGSISTKASGAHTDGLLIPVALIGLAGFGAALATGGLLRRLVGLVLAVGGVWTSVLAVIGLLSAPASLLTDLNQPAESSEPADLNALGPLLGAVGGLLIATAGILLGLGYGARRALGARYDAPTRRRAGVATDTDRVQDAEAASDWWKALDAGDDPTAGGQSDRVTVGDSTGRIAADGAATDPTGGAAPAPGPVLPRLPGPDDPGVSDGVTRGG